jgi:hypothetical protein
METKLVPSNKMGLQIFTQECCRFISMHACGLGGLQIEKGTKFKLGESA